MGVLLSDSVLHACDIVFDIRHAVPAIFGAELDNGRADDHTVSMSSHFLRLLRCGDSEADRTRSIRYGFDQLGHSTDIGRDLASCSGNTERRNTVDKSICFFCDHADPVMGGWCDHGYQIQIILLTDAVELILSS